MKVLRALGNNVVVKDNFDEEQVSEGGILMGSKKEATPTGFEGEVLLVGPDQKDIHVGDVVYFSQYGGIKFESNGCKYMTVKPDEISAAASEEATDTPAAN